MLFPLGAPHYRKGHQMRRFERLAVRILAMSIPSLMLAGAIAAQNITDYKPPISSARSLLFNADYNYATKGDSTTANNGNAKVIYKHFFTSLPYSWSLDADGNVSNFGDDFDGVGNVSGRINKYFSEQRDQFYFAGLDGAHTDSYDNPKMRVSAGVGHGRFISATAYAKAIRIDHFLFAEGVVTAHLDRKTLIEVGNIIEREGEFKDTHGSTYQSHWYSAIEDAIVASGKTKSGDIGAAGILRIQEVLSVEKVQDRFYGWDVTTGLGYDLTTAFKGEDRNPTADFGVRFSYPLNIKSQFNYRGQYNTALDDFGSTYNLLSTTDYTYELSNRIDYLLGYQFQRNEANGAGINSQNLRSAFIFFVENSVNLVLNGQLDKTGAADWNSSLILTLGYRIF